MDWHRDAVLYELPQVEYSLVLRASKTACMEWLDENAVVHRVQQVPNHAYLVRAGGVLHRVPPIGEEAKVIVKGSFSLDDRKTARHGRFLEQLRARSRVARDCSRGCLSSFVFGD